MLLFGADGQEYGVALSDPMGRFQIAVPRPGAYTLSTRRLGYHGAKSGVIQVPADTVVEVVVTLSPAPLTLDTVTVSAEMLRIRPVVEFYRRRNERRGYNFNPIDFERLNASRLEHVLRAVPTYRFSGGPTVRDDERSAGVWINRHRCEPSVFIDGSESPMTFLELAEGLPLHQVHGVEVFPTIAEAPPEFSVPRLRERECGVILIWTVSLFR